MRVDPWLLHMEEQATAKSVTRRALDRCFAQLPAQRQRQTTMDQQERIQAASKFLLQSPPGEINDVLNGEL